MKTLPTLISISCLLVVATAHATVIDCEDYSGVPRPVSSLSPEHDYRSPVAVGDGFCAISDLYDLQGWSVDADGVPQYGGALAPTHGHVFSQLAVHGQRIYAANGSMGVVVHELVDATPVAVDSILVTRTSRLAAVADDVLVLSRGAGRLLFVDLAGPTPALVDSLDLADLVRAGAHGAGGLVLVQTGSPPRAHIVDPAVGRILGALDIPWTTRFVSWDGRLAVLRNDANEETILLDASDPTAPTLQPLPELPGLWFVGGAMVDGLLWLTGCDFESGGVLARFDMADPANPVFLGRQPWNDTMTESIVSGEFVHAFTEPIIMCTPGSETIESMWIGESDPVSGPVAATEDNAFDSADHSVLAGALLCRTDGYRLQIVDFADPAAPVARGEVSLPETLTSERIFASGSRVVITGSGSGLAPVGGRIFVYDVSDPDLPEQLAGEVCYRPSEAACEGERIYIFGVDDDLHVWRMDLDGSVSPLVEHSSLFWDDDIEMLAYGDLLFVVDDRGELQTWDFADPFEPTELPAVPGAQVYDIYRLARWAGGIYWYGRMAGDARGYEMLTVTDGVPEAVRLVWRNDFYPSSGLYGDGVIDRGDRLYLGGQGILAVDLSSETPEILGLIPSSPGRLHLINDLPVVESYKAYTLWAPACGGLITGQADLPPASSPLTVWPNPFNPRLTVEFMVTGTAPVTVSVFDLRGRKLRALAEGRHESGRHAVHWDGRDRTGRIMAAGVYIVRLEQGGRASSRRVIMVK